MSARERRQARCLRSSLHLHSRRQARPGTHALPQADAGRSPMHPTATLRSSSLRQGTMVRHHAQQRNPPLALICRADTQGKNRRSQGPSTLQPPLADDTRRTSRLACPPLRCQHQNGHLSVLAPPKRTRIRSSELMPGRAAPTAPQPQPGRAARQPHPPPSSRTGGPSLRDGPHSRRIRRIVKPRHYLNIQHHIPVAIVSPRLVGRDLRYPPSQGRAAKRALCGVRGSASACRRSRAVMRPGVWKRSSCHAVRACTPLARR